MGVHERVFRLLTLTLGDIDYSQIDKNPEMLRELAEVLCGYVKLQNPGADQETLRRETERVIETEIKDPAVQAITRKLIDGYQQEFGFWSIEQIYEAMGRRWEGEPEDPGSARGGAKLPRTHLWARSYHIAWDLRLIHRLRERWGENGLMVLECMRRYASRSKATYGECAVYPSVVIREAKLPFRFATQVHRIQDTITELGLFRRAGFKLVGTQSIRRFMECKPAEILRYAQDNDLISDEVLENAAMKACLRQAYEENEAEIRAGGGVGG